MFKFLIFLYSINAQALCVTSSSADLRAGPGTKHKITWRVPKYMPLLERQLVSGWYEVEDQDGDRHWVNRKNVTTKLQCVSVKVQKASLRTGPGETFARADVWFADKYVPFKRLDIAENGWYEVEAAWGKTYWLHPDLVWRPVKVMDISY